MSSQNHTSVHRVIPLNQPVGGAVIDAQGREIPITESMIRRACSELEKHCIAAPLKPTERSDATPASHPVP